MHSREKRAMKTRVIQDDPDQPTTKKKDLTAAPAEPTRPTNLAARLGRWRARHRRSTEGGRAR
jgi:hypothetical protein